MNHISIAAENWVGIRLRPHPSLHVLHLSWNVVQLWQSIVDNNEYVEPVKNTDTIPWVLWRHQLVNQFRSLSPEEVAALDAALHGLTFGEICEIVCAFVPEEDAGMYAATLLKSWIESGMFNHIFME